MKEEISIKAEALGKVYNLYEKPIHRLKEALLFSKKKYHSDYNALKDVSFEVKKGETFGIIGTNGAGKSTLLKLITGVAKPTTGKIEVTGKISALLELGAGFNVEYSGIQNIYLHGTMMGYKKEEIDTKVKQITEFADIGDFIYQPVKTYSSGMFARLAFAVAINVEPDILIVDEALSVGDVFFQNKCYKKFEDLRKKGITVVFVSHDISSVKQMCSRVLWLEDGQQRMIGDSVEVCNAYSTMQIESNNIQNKTLVGNANPKESEIDKESDISIPLLVPAIRNCNDGIFSEKAEILSVFFTDHEGNIVEQIRTKEECAIHIISKFREDLKNVIVGFNIETIKGLRILGENTYVMNRNVYSVTEGELLAVSFIFSFPDIETGNYLISPAIAVGTQETPVILTWINSAQQIRVERQGYNLALLNMQCKVNTNILSEISTY